jgi:hypothetical protein
MCVCVCVLVSVFVFKFEFEFEFEFEFTCQVKETRAFPVDLIRISVGIESSVDLINALRAALDNRAGQPALTSRL